ncbi:unnamed protein product, partial [Staurois parvus]
VAKDSLCTDKKRFCIVTQLASDHNSILLPTQGKTDHLSTRALPEGPGSVGGPKKFPWYLFYRLF